MAISTNPYSYTLEKLDAYKGKEVLYYSLNKLNDSRVLKLPYCIRILLECAIRNCDNFEISEKDVKNILDWKETSELKNVDISFKPARVVLQDFTGVPALVDLAAMRDAIISLRKQKGELNEQDEEKCAEMINPLVPVDLVVDHSIQADFARSVDAMKKNEEIEFERNSERFGFLKWGANSFKNMLIVPPGSGIIHQVNLEYLARVVFEKDGIVYPDSLVGTDSHTTMIDGLGIVGWGVGGIEAEAVMLGQPISMVLPQVVGFKLKNNLSDHTTATDLVLTVTKILRDKGVVGKFVEFFGDGCRNLSIADRATIANMSPEYGATMGFFAFDDRSVEYMKQTGRNQNQIDLAVSYFKQQKLYRNYEEEETQNLLPNYSEIIELDLSSVVACLAGPKRPQDQTPLKDIQQDFLKCLKAPIGFKGFGVKNENLKASGEFVFNNTRYEIRHGSVVIAAITSCTNTSNPSVMLGAALLAKNAVEKGLSVLPYIKTSLSPGSKVVLRYLQESNLLPYLEQLGFYTAGFGCMTCIGNSGDLANEEIANVITKNDLVVTSVLSGNRNFEGRVHPLTKANYLASPLLCVAYAIAGTIDIQFDVNPIGKDRNGKEVYLRDIWPLRSSIDKIISETVIPKLFTECYSNIKQGNNTWNQLKVPEGQRFQWNDNSTYIHNPPFFNNISLTPPPVCNITNAYCLLQLGDSITTDHISPAGKIARDSPAAIYLQNRNVTTQYFNSYGSRRGNDEIMMRGTFANIRIINLLNKDKITGAFTTHIPTNKIMPIFDAAMKYQQEGSPLIVIAGSEYGSGSSRDWAAKGPLLLGIKAVIAKSFERIHRSNLIGMGILPLQFMNGDSVDTLNINCKDKFCIEVVDKLNVGAILNVQTESGISFKVRCKIDTDVELAYYLNGGILQYVLRKLVK